MQAWLRSGQYALLENIALRPRGVESSSAGPMVIESEEGFAYFLIDKAERGWILKKFLAGQEPDRAYVEAIRALIPRLRGFESGFGRNILKSSSVSRAAFCTKEFQAWMEGTVLMPQVVAPTWSEFADSIRDGSVVLATAERIRLCCKLSGMVDSLESVGAAHRDLSSRNILIDPLKIEPHLIDWDNLYHATLKMQPHATFGTDGYIPPFITVEDVQDVHLSWHEKSDRFALTVLNSEFLVIRAGSACVEDGGLLAQNEIDNGSGRTLFEVRNTLCDAFPGAVKFLDAALSACSFAECPSPSDWIKFTGR